MKHLKKYPPTKHGNTTGCSLIRHLDDDTTHNVPSNLAWGTHKDNYEDAVYLLFHPPNLDRFKEFVDGEYDRTQHLIEDYDVEKDFIVLVYSLNPKFKNDFELIKQGKYSKTSNEFQSIFPKVVKVMKKGLPREETTLQYRIFNKSDDLREYWESRIAIDLKDEFEVWNGYDFEKEIMDITRIKELI